MLVESKVTKGNRVSKKVEYVEPTREGSTAITKEAIVSKYSESYQLNEMRKAILSGDNTKLQEIEDYINDTTGTK